jgi:AcrR family transcriptional regulator
MENIAEKKKAILETTLELVKENGFHGTPMSMVAKKACVACGTIYHYFDSKDTLIMELHDYVKDKMVKAIVEGDDEKKSFKERFFHFCTRHYYFYVKNPNDLYFFEQYINSPYNNRSSQNGNEQSLNTILKFIKKGVDTGILKSMDYRLMGILIHSNVRTAAKVHLSERIKIEAAELEQVVQIIWDGVENKNYFQ